MVFLVFLMLSSLKNTKTKNEKKHNRDLGNERCGSIRLFGIMSNKRPGNVLIIMMLTSILIPFLPEYYKEFVAKIIFSLRIIHKNNLTMSMQHNKKNSFHC